VLYNGGLMDSADPSAPMPMAGSDNYSGLGELGPVAAKGQGRQEGRRVDGWKGRKKEGRKERKRKKRKKNEERKKKRKII
jgi:hypothetical protein